MSPALRTVIGGALVTFSVVALAYIVYQLLQIGTCASGGPYEIANECPEGTELLGFGIPVGILAGFIGAAVHPSSRAFLWFWVGTFGGISLACFWGVWGPDANPPESGEAGGLIVGFLFIFFAAAGIAALISSYRGRGPGRLEHSRLAQTTMRVDLAARDRGRLSGLILNLVVVGLAGWGTLAAGGAVAPDLPDPDDPVILPAELATEPNPPEGVEPVPGEISSLLDGERACEALREAYPEATVECTVNGQPVE